LPPAVAVGLYPLAVQLDGAAPDPAGELPVLLAGDRRRLSPPAHPPQLPLPEVAGAHPGPPGRLLPPGLPGTLGHGTPAAPPALRPTARSAQPAGGVVLGPHGLAVRGEPAAQHPGRL